MGDRTANLIAAAIVTAPIAGIVYFGAKSMRQSRCRDEVENLEFVERLR